MKLSFLGKVLLADAAIDVAKAIYNRSQSSREEEDDEEDDFSNVEIRSMMEAVARNDYSTFAQIFRDRKPLASNNRIRKGYEWFQDAKRNNWQK